jgi:hypothetical protein
MSVPLLPFEPLRGLDERDRERATEAFFEAFPWEGAIADPKTMSAERFFQLL